MPQVKKKNLVEDQKEIARLKPKHFIHQFYNKVSVKTAAIVILIAVLVQFVIMACLGLPSLGKYLIFSLVNSFIVTWLFAAVILFLIMYFIKGSDVVKPKDFNKILSGLASFKMILVIFLMIGTIITFIFTPKLLSYIHSVFTNPTVLLSTTAVPVMGLWSSFGMFLLYVVMVLLFIYMVAMMYHLIGEMFAEEKRSFKITLLVILLVVLTALLYFF